MIVRTLTTAVRFLAKRQWITAAISPASVDIENDYDVSFVRSPNSLLNGIFSYVHYQTHVDRLPQMAIYEEVEQESVMRPTKDW